MTYNVFGGMLNLAQSDQSQFDRDQIAGSILWSQFMEQ